MLPTRVLRAAKGSKANITGFNLRDFRASGAIKRYDPWARAEAWRSEGHFSRYNRFKNALPGLGIGSAAFAAYCVYEHFFLQDEHHHGQDDHAQETSH
ncbi:hypothetical protein CDD82_3808 [Ophiocordyceps australis]|uniref:NADH dehydrogenase [ubiquinone] 1 beta subcomplex subunit 3 n=1 Tax=Ophiocordyceps australis TaxID=1399860 RepID=A0A2C5ZW89_9HYPO|nr:hypothetical protein CDD82_3808 [Ophiocordyceps australis]